ncbi:MAG: T9SS type A sorting domain-containing protein [Bacteroidetes bacterium]|nr:T9SS type A sorting domain-containing protein [Bacteroidota bacterium]
MKKKYSLTQYSLAAGAILAPVAAFSQAVYTDIDPDIILDEPGEHWGFDLDDDGLNDFNFFNTLLQSYMWPIGDASAYRIWVGAFDTMQNGIAGSQKTILGYYGTFYQYYPFALDSGITVDQYLNFENWNYQRVACQTFFVFGSSIVSWTGGNWFPNKTENFLGFRFTNEEAIQHYGWIRCSVIDSGHTLIIHDYAYESKPDTPILTGDTIGDTTTVSVNNLENLNAVVYSFNKNIYIQLKEYNDAEYFIYDISGRLVYNARIKNETTICNIELPGVYLINIKTAKGKQFSKKLVVAE